MKRLAPPLLAAAALAGCALPSDMRSDWERAHIATVTAEEQASPPRYPRAADLVAFDPGTSASGFRFLVDAATLSVGRDGIVRYALVARSVEGVDNVTFEGMRCTTREYRIYAFGHEDGTWSARPGAWQTLRGSGVAPARRTLERDYFCRDGRPAYSVGEVVAALRTSHRSPDTGD